MHSFIYDLDLIFSQYSLSFFFFIFSLNFWVKPNSESLIFPLKQKKRRKKLFSLLTNCVKHNELSLNFGLKKALFRTGTNVVCSCNKEEKKKKRVIYVYVWRHLISLSLSLSYVLICIWLGIMKHELIVRISLFVQMFWRTSWTFMNVTLYFFFVTELNFELNKININMHQAMDIMCTRLM